MSDIRHYCPTLLYPKYRSFKNCTNKEHYLCCKCIRDQLKILHGEYLISNIHEHPPKPQKKKLETTDTLFAYFEDDNLCIEDSSSDRNETFDHENDEYEYKLNTNQNIELDRYLIMFINKPSLTNNPLDFCKFHSKVSFTTQISKTYFIQYQRHYVMSIVNFRRPAYL